MKTYYYHILPNDYDVVLIAVVEQNFWNKNRCLDDSLDDNILTKTVIALGGNESSESIFEFPVDISEEMLIETMLQNQIKFIKNENFSSFMTN